MVVPIFSLQKKNIIKNMIYKALKLMTRVFFFYIALMSVTSLCRAQVIPGGVTYLNPFYAIQVESEFLGIPVSLYLDQLIGKQIFSCNITLFKTFSTFDFLKSVLN